MNNKGFTLVELLATIVVIAIVMGIVFPSAVRISRENKNRIYEEYAKMMEEYALVNEKKGAEKILLSELENLDKVKTDCNNLGYVKLVDTNPIKYQAHLKCGDWVSASGFNETEMN